MDSAFAGMTLRKSSRRLRSRFFHTLLRGNDARSPFPQRLPHAGERQNWQHAVLPDILGIEASSTAVFRLIQRRSRSQNSRVAPHGDQAQANDYIDRCAPRYVPLRYGTSLRRSDCGARGPRPHVSGRTMAGTKRSRAHQERRETEHHGPQESSPSIAVAVAPPAIRRSQSIPSNYAYQDTRELHRRLRR